MQMGVCHYQFNRDYRQSCRFHLFQLHTSSHHLRPLLRICRRRQYGEDSGCGIGETLVSGSIGGCSDMGIMEDLCHPCTRSQHTPQMEILHFLHSLLRRRRINSGKRHQRRFFDPLVVLYRRGSVAIYCVEAVSHYAERPEEDICRSSCCRRSHIHYLRTDRRVASPRHTPHSDIQCQQIYTSSE